MENDKVRLDFMESFQVRVERINAIQWRAELGFGAAVGVGRTLRCAVDALASECGYPFPSQGIGSSQEDASAAREGAAGCAKEVRHV